MKVARKEIQEYKCRTKMYSIYHNTHKLKYYYRIFKWRIEKTKKNNKSEIHNTYERLFTM